MKSSPHPPFLSPLLFLQLLLLPALPVQAWFVRLLLSSSAHRQTKPQIDPFFFFFSAHTELRPRLPQQRRWPLSWKRTGFSSEIYLSSCTFFFGAYKHREAKNREAKTEHGKEKEIWGHKADVGYGYIGWKMFGGWKWMYAG